MKLRDDKQEINDLYGNGNTNLIIANDDDKYAKAVWLADNIYAPKLNEKAESLGEKIEILRDANILQDFGFTTAEKVQAIIQLQERGIIGENEFTEKNIETLSETARIAYEEKVNNLTEKIRSKGYNV